ncbi:hypothetical protein CAPTEDRAFT_225496 [Capitella teleta]|uniref:BRCT domain-containing protein n=1 Tax=Capitella teleta TaxID=283909 RepID=R7T9A8_CAPTE|nr:hypothetical protein CAPTEDRAFT_225496 [Capitella teleta]|eukprot:ELT90028.1 hypothetical protein CAPTEDRAFT_225496 [Capitella teleta]
MVQGQESDEIQCCLWFTRKLQLTKVVTVIMNSSVSSPSLVCRFVKAGDTPSSVCSEAFEEIRSLGPTSEWLSTSDALKVEGKDRRFLYVFEEFSGAAFEHIASTGNRIYGPICVLHCMKNEQPLPRLSHPVYSLAMKGITVSCTGLPKATRETLHHRVQWMCGEVSKDFHEGVTHLVAGEVGSKKYLVAANLGKSIMAPEWLDAVYESSKASFTHASEAEFNQWKCPLLRGYVITVSGLNSSDRQKIKETIEREGGRYTGEMKINECTHLIINEAKGQKYEFAKKWRIHIVRPDWLNTCIEAGYAVEEYKYKVTEGNPGQGATISTPNSSRNLSNVSNLSNLSAISMTHINETANTTMQTTFNQTRSVDPLDLLVQNMPSRGDMFLDGCKIFLSGFNANQLEKLRRIINHGGGTRFNQINGSVSHVIIGDRVDEDLEQIERSGLRPHVVTVDWLVDCLNQGRCMPEESYHCLDATMDTTEQSYLKTPKAGRINNNSFAQAPKTVVASSSDDMADIMSQYLPNNSQAGGSLGESTLLRAAMGTPSQDRTLVEPETLRKDKTYDEDMTQDLSGGGDMTSESQNVKIFAKKTFVIVGFDGSSRPELEEFIQEAGGKVLPENTRRSIPDYALVPLFSVPVEMTVGEVVTNAWLQMCVQDGIIYPTESNPVFLPMDVDQDARPLEGCVLSISCQEFFVKKAQKNLKGSTHLITALADGSKYTAAKKWKLPALHKEWLIDSLKSGRRLPEVDYDVDIPLNTGENDESATFEEIPHFSVPAPIVRAEDKAEVKEMITTPLMNTRVMELRHGVTTPHQPAASTNGTPGESPFSVRPRINLGSFLDSPPTPQTPGGTKKSRLSEASELGELMHQQLTKRLAAYEDKPEEKPDQRRFSLQSQPMMVDVDSPAVTLKALHGVVVVVAKKLSKQQRELNALAVGLGAEYIWTYNSKCTHYIFQGRQNDLNKEFRMARDDGKTIVSPHWLNVCAEQNCRVDESLFPHTFNPSMSLSVSSTPALSTRRSARTRAVCSKGETEAPAPIADLFNSKMDQDVLNATQSDEEMALACGDAEEEQKENKTDLYVKQLQNLMEVTKTTRSKRRTRKTESPDTNSSSEMIRNLSRNSLRDSIDPERSKNKSHPFMETASEPSQMYEVSWDDPGVRKQQEILAPELLKNSESFSPKMHIEGDKDSDNEITFKAPEVTNVSIVEEPPSPAEEEPEIIKRHFLFSGFPQKDKANYTALIERLGGIATDAGCYESTCTHLVVGTSCSSVHLTLLKSSEFQLNPRGETEHEWGGECTQELIKTLPPNMGKLARAAHRWRKSLSQENNSGAFQSWKVMLMTDKKKENGFKRLLEAGGALVCPADVDISSITHLFIEPAKIETKVDLQKFVDAGIHCVKPEYIAAFLTENVSPKPAVYYVPEALALVNSKDKKRKASGGNTENAATPKKRPKT